MAAWVAQGVFLHAVRVSMIILTALSMTTIFGVAAAPASFDKHSLTPHENTTVPVSSPGEAEARYAGKGLGHEWTPAPTSSFGKGPCESSIEHLLSPVRAFGDVPMTTSRALQAALVVLYE